MKFIVIVSLLLFLPGCTVGRFVTNVSSNGPGKLTVEKCTTKAFGDFFWNTECGENTVNLPTPQNH